MLTALDRGEIKGVTKFAVKEAGGQENAANVCARITRPATFSDYANLNEPTIIALDAAIELDQFNDNTNLIGKAAEFLGCVIYRKPVTPIAETDEQGLLKVAKESTEAVAAAWGAKADGVITPEERADVTRQFDEAVVALLELRARWTMGKN